MLSKSFCGEEGGTQIRFRLLVLFTLINNRSLLRTIVAMYRCPPIPWSRKYVWTDPSENLKILEFTHDPW